MLGEGDAAKEVRRAWVHFFVEVRLALDAPADDKAKLDGVRYECSDPKVRLLECDYVCWFWCGVGDNCCFGFALAGAEGQRVYRVRALCCDSVFCQASRLLARQAVVVVVSGNYDVGPGESSAWLQGAERC